MVFRFAAAIALVVAVSLAGVALEKRSLELRREISRQHFRENVLRENHARLRLRTQELGAPSRLVDAMEEGELLLEPRPDAERTGEPAAPLLFWDAAPPRDW